jgi:L-threonylcarbamoyladenylate synthase
VWSEAAREELAAAVRDGGLSLTMFTALPAEASAYAQAIFAALHDADAAGLDALVIERVPDAPAWWAVADRLRRAAEA